MQLLRREKLDQATRLVAESELDVWMTFVRETHEGCDPILPYLVDGGFTWDTALLVCRSGRRIAVVGNFDAPALEQSGHWDQVVPYVQGIKNQLLGVLEAECGPSPRIGINFSPSDSKADGLTHGMYLVLEGMLAGTRFSASLTGAESIASRLRAQKTREELRRIRAAIADTELLFEEIAGFAREGTTELEVFEFVHRIMHDRGLGFGWDSNGDPIVNSGPNSMVGHGRPSAKIRLEAGHIFHVDLGVVRDGYSSDIQRCWFVGGSVPDDVSQAAEAVSRAISEAAAFLRPDVQGWEVDRIGRESIVRSGYAEYMHALGHQVGRAAHDGGTVLAPRWDRYRQAPYGRIQVNEVYTLELGIDVPGRGYLGLEEMVVVTESGCEFLTMRQTELRPLPM